jgi:hypothetical protein
VLDSRRENWRGVRRGALSGAEGKSVMWRGLFYCFINILKDLLRPQDFKGLTFLPIMPRQAIEGIAVMFGFGEKL